ncbi:hypothetical protein [Kitasatospora sp. NPDC097691]|uniref:hypothetical protein n=1 Tax=Kitasatospora sp. NPDC097691 TaxID=3157231 RepID=UPI00331CA017
MADTPVFDEIADTLYALAPADFTAARNARADEVKKSDPQLAKRVRALHRPTLAAWAANLLAHRHGDLVGRLLDLGQELRDAQQHLAGDRLRTLTDRRRRLVRELTEQAQRDATTAGHPLGADAAADLDRTLSAALADPDAARALAAGRLTAALEPPLWPGAAPLGAEPERPEPRLSAEERKGSAARPRTQARAEQEQEREQEREREQARSAVAAAERAEREAADRAAEAERELRRATSARRQAQDEAERAAAGLAQARERDGHARTAVARADDRVQAAEDTADAARAEASRAREAGQGAAARLRTLEDGGRGTHRSRAG